MADETRRLTPPPRTDGSADEPAFRVGTRSDGGGDRMSPRMRLDVLQVVAVVTGFLLLLGSLVALARMGFSDLGAFEPVVEVAGRTASPLHAGIWALLGLLLITAGFGDVAERRLRILGVLVALAGAVFVAEPDAFSEYLGPDPDRGLLLITLGAVLAAATFLPPLSIRRPGVGG